MMVPWRLAFVVTTSKILARSIIITPTTTKPAVLFCSNDKYISMSSSGEEEKVVTQGEELQNFYGEETAQMYAGMMDEELKKAVPDLQTLLEHIPSSGGIIFDTCVGSGHMLEWIYNKNRQIMTTMKKNDGDDDDAASILYPLHGIDLSTDMLNQARKRLSSTGAVLGNANMLETSPPTTSTHATTSPSSQVVQPNSCAAVLNTFALHHVTEQQAEKAIQDWSSLLKDDGGCLYLGLWEGTGYMEEFPPGTKTLMHPEKKVNEWIQSAGLQIIMSRTKVEEEMGNLNTLYVICQKNKKNDK